VKHLFTFHSLKVDGPWLIIALLLLWILAKNIISALLTKVANGLADALLRLLSGSKSLNRLAIRHYRRKVSAKYAKADVPFVDGLHLDMRTVYVQLKRSDEHGQELDGDAYASVRNNQFSVVLGPPGAGKSMLLRNSMLLWAEKRSERSAGTIPVLVNLRRCDGSTPLLDGILAALREDGFRGSSRFVRRALTRGHLRMLFDGLDEVATEKRAVVTDQLRRLAAECNDSDGQMVVTCRSAIYEGQLRPEFSNIVRVAEFTDAQIAQFLLSWPLIDDVSVVNQLLAALQDAPRIKQLARNPLLLTMIAYLYSDVRPGQSFKLPTSRSQFYKEAVSELLRMKREREYREPEKKIVLQKLAILAYDQPAGARDRMTLGYAQVIDCIAQTVVRLNLERRDAAPMLDEIVERSGLMIRIDAGDRFQFAHLTLQEFLAAAELAEDAATLLGRYYSDPVAWREPLKLWCGLVSQDCTDVVRKVYANDPTLGFECIVEANHLSEDLVAEIMTDFKGRLTMSSADEAVIGAVAAVAADSRPRGRSMFGYLADLARADNIYWNEAAVAALAKTSLPEAARVLVRLGYRNAALTSAIVAMGDLAVPALAEAAVERKPYMIEMLARIGTASAIRALADLLARTDVVAYWAAWAIGRVLTNPRTLAIVGEFDAADIRGITSLARCDWVGRKYADWGPNARAIVSRAAWLIMNCPDDAVPMNSESVATMIALPVVAVGLSAVLARAESPAVGRRPRFRGAHARSGTIRDGELRLTMPDGVGSTSRSSDLWSRLLGSADTVFVNELKLLKDAGVPARYIALLDSLEDMVRTELLRKMRAYAPSVLQPDDWIAADREIPRGFERGGAMILGCGSPVIFGIFGLSLGLDWSIWRLLAWESLFLVILAGTLWSWIRRSIAVGRAERNPLRGLLKLSERISQSSFSIIAD
jgi:hypothetical protein